MASASDENENHWPGYVDALTTMTMMLIFVMMILSIAMFSMSENVSRSLVEKIAESAGVTVSGENLTTEDLAQKVSEKIEEKKLREVVKAGQGLPGEERKISSGADAITRKDNEPVQTARSPALLTLTFKPRAISLDEPSHGEMKAFLEGSGHVSGEGRMELRAYANAEAGGISDSRRVAYYRAMTIRTRLIALGIAASRITVMVEDRPVAEQAEIVQIFAR
jgi:hypothetical protein